MGDIAQILAPTASAVPGIAASSEKAVKMAGMSDKAMYFMKGNQDPASASLPPVVPTFSKLSDTKKAEEGEVKVKVGSKWISSSKRARPWTWAPFASSSRSDGAMFNHWVRKNVEYTDYPYAKFDVHMDPVTYTPDEYEAHLQSETWTKSETDRLMELARIFECRWPVIVDRFCLENNTNRKIEDLQQRYYGVAAVLAQLHISQEAASEARALSVAAAKSAATTIATATIAPTPATTPSSVVASPVAAMAKQQQRTDNILLESAAARSLATTAKQHQPLMNHVGTGTSNKMFDYEKEKERRHNLDRLWRRSKEEEEEEIQLRKELKTIEAQLRKLKKHGGHVLAATKGRAKSVATTPARAVGAPALPGQLSNAPSSRGPSRANTPAPDPSSAAQGDLNDGGDDSNINSDIVDNPDTLDEYFASTAPVPMSQYPYLMSGRLVPPASGGSSGINKSLLTRMNEVLSEFNIPERPVPTKRVCDMYDHVRKDVLTLLTLKKMLMQREGQLQSKRLRLSRIGGSMLTAEDKVLDEERLLGISPPPKPSSSPASPAKAKTTKRKSPSTAASKTKATAKKLVDTKAVGDTTVKKKTVKRKRKAEPGKSPTAASSSVKSLAVGLAAAKAAKARATAAAPTPATTPSAAIAISSVGAPKGTTTPTAKASTAATVAKTTAGSAAKRSRKS
mmetsp:Transcript_8299/g.17202  ORF Transcript_8299/g.17202 Transcript_8299/m.17202 type:complete len:680 (-) Transcript_8299:63-2102(-)